MAVVLSLFLRDFAVFMILLVKICDRMLFWNSAANEPHMTMNFSKSLRVLVETEIFTSNE